MVDFIDRNRRTVADMRATKAEGRKISMLYVQTLEEAAAADEAGIDMLSIESRFFSPEMREAAGKCFVQVGLPFGQFGDNATAEDYLRGAFHYTSVGADCIYCAASFDIQKELCDNYVPIVAHVGFVPANVTWTGWRAVGKTAAEALDVYRQVKRLEAIGAFGAELEVIPDRVGEMISKNTTMLMLGMGAGPGADAQYLFTEDVLGHTSGHKPRHAKTYRNFAAEYERLQKERVAAFREFIADVHSGAYPAPEHIVPIEDGEFEAFLAGMED